MECKSCGSVKFKKIRYGLYECEYCGREVEKSDVLRVDNPMNNMFIDNFGYCVIDPTRTIVNTINAANEINEIRVRTQLEQMQDKIKNLITENKKTEKCCISLRKAIRELIRR